MIEMDGTEHEIVLGHHLRARQARPPLPARPRDEDLRLVCMFTPALKGDEAHDFNAESPSALLRWRAGPTSRRGCASPSSRTSSGSRKYHRDLHIAPSEEFDAVAGIARTLDEFHIPDIEKGEGLAAFAEHKGEVTEGSRQPAAVS